MGARKAVQRFYHLTLNQIRRQIRTLMLLFCGAGALGVYLLLTLQYPLEKDVLFPLVSIGWLSHYAPGAAALYGLCMLLLLVFYLSAYWSLRRAATSTAGLSTRAAQIILLFPILAMLILVHLYPITSLEGINQAIQVRVLTAHHANPLLMPASAYSADPFTIFDDAQNLPSPAGPLWILLSAGPALLAGNNLLALVLLEKMLPILFVLGSLRLVWLIASRVAPYRRWQALLLVGWNPLLLLETAGNGQNTSAVIFFLLLAFYLLIAGPRWLALPIWAGAALVDSAALIFLPLLAVALWRLSPPARRARSTFGSGTLALAIIITTLLPFGGVQALSALLQPLDQAGLSLPTLLSGFFQPFYGAAPATSTINTLALACFGLWYLFILARLIRRSSLQPVSDKSLSASTLLTAGYEVPFWFFVLAAVDFQPWLILWLIPFAALDTRLMPWIRTTVMAGAGLLVPILLIFVTNAALLSGSLDLFTIQLLAVLSLFAPVLAIRSGEAIYQRRRLAAALAAKEAELAQLQRQLHSADQASQ